MIKILKEKGLPRGVLGTYKCPFCKQWHIQTTNRRVIVNKAIERARNPANNA